MTDIELMARSSDELWYVSLCLDDLHRLPSEVNPILTCREYTLLKARSIVLRAQQDLIQVYRKA